MIEINKAIEEAIKLTNEFKNSSFKLENVGDGFETNIRLELRDIQEGEIDVPKAINKVFNSLSLELDSSKTNIRIKKRSDTTKFRKITISSSVICKQFVDTIDYGFTVEGGSVTSVFNPNRIEALTERR